MCYNLFDKLNFNSQKTFIVDYTTQGGHLWQIWEQKKPLKNGAFRNHSYSNGVEKEGYWEQLKIKRALLGTFQKIQFHLKQRKEKQNEKNNMFLYYPNHYNFIYPHIMSNRTATMQYL